MYTFTDLMRQAQGGRAVENFAGQFGVTPGDVEKLMATLLPVYAMGLQRNVAPAADPFGFVAALRQGPFKLAFESWEAAASKVAQEAGREALERIFGSKEIAKAVADQAALMTGLTTELVNRMMPMLTTTLLGGVGREVEKTPLAAMMDQWAKAMPAGFQAGMPAAKPSAAPENPFAVPGNPFADAVSAFWKGYSDGPAPAKPPEPPPSPLTEGTAALGKLFDAGLEMQETNRKAFERIMESYLPK
ncbi:DUF937 domain-containing protein [Methylobrevis albus]|uniref:DUF937 domain-containing protein n=1 Tax=Methylobrevis albus TaxID=2793297 RepID=A0A931MZM0_9HYPH|nr:DUF937 domain-containing protein [Methylobrevis albus]MBH0238224.1 DUF937 domain-containing protein [Methylobrevis albus]